MKGIQKLIDKYINNLFALDNVVGVGTGYKEIKGRKTNEECIVVLVEKKVNENNLAETHIIPESIEEQKTDVIEIGKVELLSTDDKARIKRLRPAQPGVSIGHYKITAGTFGAVVKDKKTGNPLILSNNHVLANITDGYDGRASKGDIILQPGSYDGGDDDNDVIGYLERFIPIYDENPPLCPLMSGFVRMLNGVNNLFNQPEIKPNALKNKVDCAVAKPKSANLINPEILGIGKIKGTTDPELDMRVKKSGRTSGLTTSRIKVLNTTVKVQLSANESAIFADQLVMEPFSQPGDSGSLVVNNNNQAVGLLFAGSDKSTICNRIDNVLEALDITF